MFKRSCLILLLILSVISCNTMMSAIDFDSDELTADEDSYIVIRGNVTYMWSYFGVAYGVYVTNRDTNEEHFIPFEKPDYKVPYYVYDADPNEDERARQFYIEKGLSTYKLPAGNYDLTSTLVMGEKEDIADLELSFELKPGQFVYLGDWQSRKTLKSEYIIIPSDYSKFAREALYGLHEVFSDMEFISIYKPKLNYSFEKFVEFNSKQKYKAFGTEK